MKYPVAHPKPHSVTFGRVSYTDPYQWLEEETPDALEFQAQQDQLTQDWLESRPVRARAKALIAAMPRQDGDFPIYSGGRWFRKRTPDGKRMQAVEVAESIEGPWRCVVDANAEGEGRLLTIDVFAPSPDGRKLVLGWGVNGVELAEWRVFEVDTGQVLMDSIRQSYAFFPAWLPDSSGFYYTARDPAALAEGTKIYRQVLGAELTTQPEQYEKTAETMWVKPAADGRHMLLIADHLNPRIEYIRDEVSGGAWRPFLKGETALFRGDILGDRCYVVTNDGAPCGRMVSIPLSTPRDRSTWKELVHGSEKVLATLLVVDDRMVLVDLVDTWSRMRVFDTDGRHEEILLPSRGALSIQQFAIFNMIDMAARGGPGEVVFPFSSPVRSAALYKANVHTLEVQALTQPLVSIDALTRSYLATSADGSRVPYHVIARADLDLSQPRPTVMTGYGGFQVALVPGWCGTYLATWVQAGGVVVLMHLRGGGELGPEMWHQGRLKHKQNSFNDVYAIAEDVIARGISCSAQLGVVGGSNGGVMAAVAAVQRPDLFRASIPQMPLTDILARARDVITMASTLDYGDPNDPEMSELIRAWSPYQNVREGTAYPATLLYAGQKDLRCPPWHVRKMAARMQVANAGDHPILMRALESVGHGAADVEGQQAQGADWLTFFADQLVLAL